MLEALVSMNSWKQPQASAYVCDQAAGSSSLQYWLDQAVAWEQQPCHRLCNSNPELFSTSCNLRRRCVQILLFVLAVVGAMCVSWLVRKLFVCLAPRVVRFVRQSMSGLRRYVPAAAKQS